MTNHWIDYRNSDIIMAIGANPAENHPVAMKWIDHAREHRGAKFVVVDPKFNRSAALADLYVAIRPGTDIAFLGGLMNYALSKERYFKDYVLSHTNATFLVDPGYKFEEGLFSGATAGQDGQVKYDTKTWQFQKDGDKYKTDPTLKDPRCVLNVMKAHYARYTPEMVSQTCGMSVEDFNKVAELFTSTGAANKAGNILYAMGITQSTHGSQNVRAIAVLQLLMGNIGIAGGGVNAQRGESNVQGSTDMAMLFNNLPGYLPYPSQSAHPTLAKYNETTPKAGYWTNRPKFVASMLKAWYGDSATKANDFCYDYLPKLDARDHSFMSIFEAIGRGEVKGVFAWGQNLAVGGPNQNQERSALAKLDWLVAVDLFETETACFWQAPGLNAKDINTEVFLLPAAASFEKQGTVANSGRWIQWRWKAVDPPGDARDDLWIADRLFKAIKKEYQSGGLFPDPILKLTWNYGDGEEPDSQLVAMEINGYNPADGKLLGGFANLKDDGTTACGCWIYSGYYADKDKPACKARSKDDPSGLGLYPGWSYAWPANRRIVYNRASCAADGKPYDPSRAIVAWDGEKWVNRDVPDFGWKNAADGKMIPPATSANAPFLMNVEGKGLLFTTGMKDGPLPEHYEPVESPFVNKFGKRQFNPVTVISGKGEFGKFATVGDEKYPYICTTYRVTEHWQSGAITRNMPWLGEMMPDMFVELSDNLANKLGVKSGDRVTVATVRGELTAPAMVSARIKPMTVHGRQVEVIGMPWHWGFKGMYTGPSANVLTPHVGDANTNIPEYKAFLCDVKRAEGTGPVRR